jgi:hypothetical protein
MPIVGLVAGIGEVPKVPPDRALGPYSGRVVPLRLSQARAEPVGPTSGNGLVNMTARAEELGGNLRVAAREPGGTVLEWRVTIGPRRRDLRLF